MKSLVNEYETYFNKIKSNWDKIAKPLDSLGKLETLVAKIGAIQKTEHPLCNKNCLVVLCSDNGIVQEGISQSDQSVTRICSENIAAKKTTVGIMAKQIGCDIFTFDVGINYPKKIKNVFNKKINLGTKNFVKQSAMTKKEVENAFLIGKKIVSNCKKNGYKVICVGEMGIGNTTTSAAITASLLKLDSKKTTGYGAGLNKEKLKKKIEVINTAIKKYDLTNKDALSVLEIVGGYDIAVMVGIFLASKEFNMPIILDGVVSITAALVAEKIKKGTIEYLIPSHISREKTGKILCKQLKLYPIIDADMALGEGTGAILALGILKTAIEVYEKSITFTESKVQQYKRFK